MKTIDHIWLEAFLAGGDSNVQMKWLIPWGPEGRGPKGVILPYCFKHLLLWNLMKTIDHIWLEASLAGGDSKNVQMKWLTPGGLMGGAQKG